VPPHVFVASTLFVATCAVLVARSSFRWDGRRYFTLLDDAMISMQYARNLAAGHGLVWNAGDTPVEGFSNPLWTLWMWVPHAFGLPDRYASLWVALSGALAVAGCAAVYGAIVARLGGSHARFLVASLVVLCYPLVHWSVLGMEVGLLALGIGFGIHLALRLEERRDRRSLAALATVLGALALVRADGVVPALAVAAVAVHRSPGGTRLRLALVLAGAIAASLAAQTLARLWYFGDPLPNTYYLKLTGVPLGARLLRALRAPNLSALAWLAPFAALAAMNGRRLAESGLAYLAAVVVGQLAYHLYVGGDAWESQPLPNRYLTTALPALVALAAPVACRLVGADPVRSARFFAYLAAWAAALLVVDAAKALAFQSVDPVVGAYSMRRALLIAADLGLAGALLIGLGVIALARRARDAALRTVVGPSGGPAPWAVLAALALVCYSGSYRSTLLPEGIGAGGDRLYALEGLALRRATAPEAVVAAQAIGAVAYFSRRRVADILGKVDPVIAHLRPRTAFHPGHDRWDYVHTLGIYQPDVVLATLVRDLADARALREAHYRRIATGLYVRRDSRAVHDDALLTALGLSPTLTTATP